MASRALLVDLYELTMAQSYFYRRRGLSATFDLFVRQLPPNRSFLLCAGLGDILDFIREFRFSGADLAYLKSLGLFTPEFLKYLGALRFRGDLWAMPEGTVFFPNEPVMRVTAGIIEAQLLESYLLNTVNLQTMLASKACRSVIAAGGRPVYDFSLRRTHGSDAAVQAARCSYLAGFAGSSNVLAGCRFGIPVAGTMAHSFVMSFPGEAEAFRAYCGVFPDRSILLVDTYDTKAGIGNAIACARQLLKAGHRLKGIRLDSGDLVSLSKYARGALDKAGLAFVSVLASGNLDEFEIRRILNAGAKIDSFGVGTHMGTSIDAPALDVIYKLSEVSDRRGRFLPVMKLSSGKLTFPGRKQVYRQTDRAGMLCTDTIALEDEKVRGIPLLVKAVDKGRVVYRTPALESVRDSVSASLQALPAALRGARPGSGTRGTYPVLLSAGLKKLTGELKGRLYGKNR